LAASTGPGNNIAAHIRNGNDGIVKS
jgi:hypothetical protein